VLTGNQAGRPGRGIPAGRATCKIISRRDGGEMGFGRDVSLRCGRARDGDGL